MTDADVDTDEIRTRNQALVTTDKIRESLEGFDYDAAHDATQRLQSRLDELRGEDDA